MPKLGEALKAIVSEQEDSLDIKGRPESVLMNPTRQKIFQHICHNPATRLRSIARNLDMNPTVVQFHLRKMTENQYLSVMEFDGAKIYYPLDMRPSDDDLHALVVLADDTGREILKIIAMKPGITPAELAPEIGRSVAYTRRLLASMETLGMLSIILDGRRNRLFPGEGLQRLEKRTRQLLRAMKSRLMRRLARDKLSPEIDMGTRHESVINIRVGGKKYLLRLPTGGLMPWLALRQSEEKV